jgi:hypothetical protein
MNERRQYCRTATVWRLWRDYWLAAVKQEKEVVREREVTKGRLCYGERRRATKNARQESKDVGHGHAESGDGQQVGQFCCKCGYCCYLPDEREV